MAATPPDTLAALLARRALTEDAARPDAVARRHASGGRTARENGKDLVAPGSWVEYARFAIAAQRKRRDLSELIARTPADGLIAGTARVAGQPCAVLSYDYTVLAGTQGMIGHAKKDRLFELIERLRLPVVFFARGRRRAARRHRPARRLVAAHARVRAVGATGGQGAADRDRPRPLLRGQRRDRGLQRPDRRHARGLPRDGRSGDDRGRRARGRRPRRDRPDGDA